MIIAATRSLIAAAAATALLLASGCGSSGDSDGPGSGDDSSAVAQAATTPADSGKDSGVGKVKPAAGDKGGDGGTITLTVDGKTSTFDSGDCVILETSDVNLSLDTNGLHAFLPPKPGEFSEQDHARVILPPPAGDEFRSTNKVHGQWAQAGERANGHVEGTAHLLSGLTSNNDRDFAFSFDFECPLSDITGG